MLKNLFIINVSFINLHIEAGIALLTEDRSMLTACYLFYILSCVMKFNFRS